MAKRENVKNWLLKKLRPTTTQRKAILFVDIVSSTELYESHGNLPAKKMVGDRLDELTATIRENKGRIVKYLGDGMLCAFSSASDAFSAAVDLSASSQEKLGIRVGVHVGEVVEEGGDVFGDAVNTAARIATLARPWEVLISSDVLEEMPSGSEKLLRPLAPVSVKGKREPLQLFAVLQMGGTDIEATIQATAERAPSLEVTRSVLELMWLDTAICVDLTRPRVAIGRQDDSGLVLNRGYVSRQHATVYLRDGKFVLKDQSANGTYLVPEGGTKLLLRREETLLHGSGHIYFGVSPEDKDAEPVHYSVRS